MSKERIFIMITLINTASLSLLLPFSYPKIEFFQSNQMRNVMVDILFIFAKENPEVSYQQVGSSVQ